MTLVEETSPAKPPMPPGSVLVAECGAANTTVALFDAAAGSYRLLARAMAPTTAVAPWHNIMEGVYEAIQQVEAITGRKLLTAQRKLIVPTQQNGAGVDSFAAVASAARPLATALVGLFDEVSLAAARRVLGSTYAREVNCLSLDNEADDETYLAALLDSEPDLIFIVGGTDGGARQRLLRLVENVSLAVGPLAEKKRFQVLFAGNKQLRQPVSNLFKSRAEVYVADNVRPTLETDNLADAIQQVNNLYSDFKINTLPGIHTLNEWSQEPAISTVEAFATITRYFAALNRGRVLGVDLGSNHVALLAADAAGVQTHMRNDLGMGQPIINLLAEVEPAAIARWLPYALSDDEIRDFIFYKSLYPQSVPVTEVETYLEQAIARELIRLAAPQPLPPFDILLARGQTLSNTARPGQSILMLLDALQPVGIFSVALDRHGVLPALGVLATQQPLAVVQALEAGILSDLGWVIVPTGKAQVGQSVVKGVVESGQGQFDLDVESGRIDTMVLRPGEVARVAITPDRRVDLGFGPGKGQKLSLRGGAVGLVVDARGRPLPTPEPDKREELIRQWYWDVGG